MKENSNFRMEENVLENNNFFDNVDIPYSTVAPTAPSASNDQEKEEILEFHVNPGRAKFNKFNLPKHCLWVETKCDSCKINSTRATDILTRKLKPHKMQHLMGKECG